MKRVIAVLIVLLAVVVGAGFWWLRRTPPAAPTPPPKPSPPQAEPLLIQENSRTRPMTPEDWKRLYEKTRKDLKSKPRSADLHFQMAVLLSLVKGYDGAASQLEEASRLAPLDARIESGAGAYYMRFGDMEAALPHLEKAHQASPSDIDIAIELARAYWSRGESSKALSLLSTASKAAGKSPELHWKVATAYIQIPLRPEAVSELKKILALQPGNLDAIHQLAFYDLDGGSPEDALKLIQKAIRIDPKDGSLYSLMGTSYVMRSPSPENLRQAETFLKQALQMGQEQDSATYYYLGKVYQREGKLQEAAATMEKVVSLSPGSRQAHYDLAQLYTQLKRPTDAAKHRETFARIYHAQDQRKTLSQMVRSKPDDAQIQFQQAVQDLEDQNPVLALPHLQRALELRPHWPEARQKLIQVYRTSGRPQRAAAVTGGG